MPPPDRPLRRSGRSATVLPLALALATSACAATPTPVVVVPPPVTVAAAAATPGQPVTPAVPAVRPTAGTTASLAALRAALAARDYDALQAMMGDAFVLGLYRSDAMTLDPAAARTLIETTYLPAADHAVDVTDDRNAFPAIDPPLETMFDPALIVNQLLFSRGWGADGRGEAVLVLAERSDGTVYWHGLVVAPSGFGGTAGGAAVDSGSRNTVHGIGGFALDAPAGWHVADSGGGLILTSFDMDAAGHGGIGAGQTKIDVLPLGGDPRPATLADAVVAVKAGDPTAAWAEGPISTASGLAGVRLRNATFTAAVIDLDGDFIVAGCYCEGCDTSGGVFDTVVASVRTE